MVSASIQYAGATIDSQKTCNPLRTSYPGNCGMSGLL